MVEPSSCGGEVDEATQEGAHAKSSHPGHTTLLGPNTPPADPLTNTILDQMLRLLNFDPLMVKAACPDSLVLWVPECE